MRFSKKQRQVLSWWVPGGPYAQREALICDGAVRSGKTVAMTIGFFLWAHSCFQGQQFAICGKTIVSVRRNVVDQALRWMDSMGIVYRDNRSENCLTVEFMGRKNRYFLFGGRDESSAALIQGSTFAGILLDEVALMPRSFVEQACARCSISGSKLWFNCNPAGPEHWFYKTWILEAENRNCLRLHFTMADNPGLTEEIRRRYSRLYTGVFYQRYVLGQWVQAEGRVYDFFHSGMAVEPPEEPCREYYISCDYGTVNPMSMGLWGRSGEVWYRLREFYFDSRQQQRQMTDEEYADALRKLAAGVPVRAVIVDPSAASFLEVLRRRGYPVRKGDNQVLSGIRLTADCLKSGRIRICRCCESWLREVECYVWDLDSPGRERVKKEHDHAMDDTRYFVTTVLGRQPEAFAACCVERSSRGGF